MTYKLMKQGRLEPIGVPSELPALLLNAPNLNLPITTGLDTHPLILPSGQVLDAEGLDADSGLVLHFGGAFRGSLAVDTISPEEGLARLREEMLGEFEFASAADEAAALALVLTAVERRVMDTAPGYMINASMQGSGKTTLARMVHLLVTGHDLPVAGMSESLDEQDKALTAMLLTSAPIVCFDNLPDGALVASRVLARVLTSSTHTGRVLGLSKMAEVPVRAVYVVTGNNITANIDLSRRLLEVRLAPQVERPEQRRFKHADVVPYVRQNRVRWMQDVLAVLRGSRLPVQAAEPSGFAQWDRIVRWPLINVGATDHIKTFDEVRARSPDHAWQEAGMRGLLDRFGLNKAFRASDLQSPCTEILDEHLQEHPPAKGFGNVRSIGRQLGKLVGRNIAGHTLTNSTVNGATRYRVTRP